MFELLRLKNLCENLLTRNNYAEKQYGHENKIVFHKISSFIKNYRKTTCHVFISFDIIGYELYKSPVNKNANTIDLFTLQSIHKARWKKHRVRLLQAVMILF
jgi:hypothetical protein